MAGDWIKLEHATVDKPEVGMAAEWLGIVHGAALELFLRYWIWLDQNLDGSGRVPFVSRASVEKMLACPGFAGILEKLSWAKFDDRAEVLTVLNWERHNGKSAKSRALEQRKKAKQRRDVSRYCPVSVPESTGLEKRIYINGTTERISTARARANLAKLKDRLKDSTSVPEATAGSELEDLSALKVKGNGAGNG